MNVHYIQYDVTEALRFMEHLACHTELALVHSESVSEFEQKARSYSPDCLILDIQEDDTSVISGLLKRLRRVTSAPVILIVDGRVEQLESSIAQRDVLGITCRRSNAYEQISRMLSVVKLVGFDPII